MSVRRRKKSRKLRGRTRTMGWGRIGQHRKTGSKGGRGAAGLLKHEWSWTIKYAPSWFGKHGFNPPTRPSQKQSEINLYRLSEIIEELIGKGKAVEENGKVVVNLDELGYTKLLGRGKIERPVKILVKSATETAIKKVEEAGGAVVSLTEQN